MNFRLNVMNEGDGKPKKVLRWIIEGTTWWSFMSNAKRTLVFRTDSTTRRVDMWSHAYVGSDDHRGPLPFAARGQPCGLSISKCILFDYWSRPHQQGTLRLQPHLFIEKYLSLYWKALQLKAVDGSKRKP